MIYQIVLFLSAMAFKNMMILRMYTAMCLCLVCIFFSWDISSSDILELICDFIYFTTWVKKNSWSVQFKTNCQHLVVFSILKFLRRGIKNMWIKVIEWHMLLDSLFQFAPSQWPFYWNTTYDLGLTRKKRKLLDVYYKRAIH